jgi:hypothetical protein
MRLSLLARFSKRKPLLIRNLDADVHLEIFLVSAIASILIIRFYLKVLGYPQLGGGGLHIAHVLWGGLLLIGALIVALTFLNRGAMRVAALLGGMGFGTFIDEVGKFVTRDNDYFYKPSYALMYVVFIAIILVGQSVMRRLHTPDECLLNALQEMEELALLDLDGRERGRALALLDGADPRNPLVQPLRTILLQAALAPDRRPGAYARGRDFLRRHYETLVSRSWFQLSVVLFFVLQLVLRLVNVILVVFFPWVLPSPEGGPPRHVTQRLRDLTMADWGQLVSTVVSAVLVAIGIIALARSRRFAYRMFKRSVLLTVFITQFFMFYDEQLTAVIGLGLNLLLLVALQTGLDLEHSRGDPAVVAGKSHLGTGGTPAAHSV